MTAAAPDNVQPKPNPQPQPVPQSQPQPQPEPPAQAQPEPRFSQEQYDMLKRCSQARDSTEWNVWREQNPDAQVLLEGAQFPRAHLERVFLKEAHLAHSNFVSANLKDANFQNARLDDAEFRHALLQGANLTWAHLKAARLFSTRLEGARLTRSDLQGASFGLAKMDGADFSYADIQDANFALSYMEGARFEAAAVNGGTLIWRSKISRLTDFTGVGLDTARIEPALKQLLQYNIRRLAWENWYKTHPILKWPVRAFWAISDYGRSTGRIVGWFFAIALGFAAIYDIFPGLTSELHVTGHWLTDAIRSWYFSVVTMTTLGFGDVCANPESPWGHLLLSLHVLSGYILLGALVTRFAVLFSAGGPEGQFAGETTLGERLVEWTSGAASKVRQGVARLKRARPKDSGTPQEPPKTGAADKAKQMDDAQKMP